jgi:hypothetical protein
MKQSCVLALAACVGLLAVTPLARADILVPGQTVPPPPLVQEGVLGPPNFASVGVPTQIPFSFGGASGTYREFVSAGRTGNPLGGLSFEYQFHVNTGVVQTFAANGLAGWQTNVTFAPGGTIPAVEADRSGGLGDVINFTLAGGGVMPGQTSEWLIVDTNAPADIPNTISLSGGGGSVNEPALGPAVPEPGTLTLALVSLLLAGAFGYWRRSRSKPALA